MYALTLQNSPAGPKTHTRLVFNKAMVDSLQVRHRERFALVPEIDFKRYQCRAVIDFMDILVSTMKSTDYKSLRVFVSKSLDIDPPYCRQLNGSENSATCFQVRIQNPQLKKIHALQVALRNRTHGLTKNIEIAKIEISVDFTQNQKSWRNAN